MRFTSESLVTEFTALWDYILPFLPFLGLEVGMRFKTLYNESELYVVLWKYISMW